MMSNPTIIIGAGVSGLAFAQGLSKHNIPFTIYERDESITARTQGYRFRIPEEGLHALEQNLTPPQFEKFRRSCCSDDAISNAPGVLLDPETAEPATLPAHSDLKGRKRPQASSVDRTALRRLLMEGIEQNVHFGKAFESYRETTDGVVVGFTDGSKVEGAALVGADGTWSKVRQQLLPSHQLVDTEGRLIFGKTAITPRLFEIWSPKCHKGTTMLFGRDRKFIVEPMYFNREKHAPTDYVYWVIFARSDEALLSGGSQTLTTDETIALARTMTREWHPSLRCIIENVNEGEIALFSIFSTLPDVQVQKNASSRVTLLGDAFHPMSPTAASGATTALKDTELLVQILQQNRGEDIAEMFRRYEGEMCGYANEAVESSAMGGKIFFGMKTWDALPVVQRCEMKTWDQLPVVR